MIRRKIFTNFVRYCWYGYDYIYTDMEGVISIVKVGICIRFLFLFSKYISVHKNELSPGLMVYQFVYNFIDSMQISMKSNLKSTALKNHWHIYAWYIWVIHTLGWRHVSAKTFQLQSVSPFHRFTGCLSKCLFNLTTTKTNSCLCLNFTPRDQ